MVRLFFQIASRNYFFPHLFMLGSRSESHPQHQARQQRKSQKLLEAPDLIPFTSLPPTGLLTTASCDGGAWWTFHQIDERETETERKENSAWTKIIISLHLLGSVLLWTSDEMRCAKKKNIRCEAKEIQQIFCAPTVVRVKYKSTGTKWAINSKRKFKLPLAKRILSQNRHQATLMVTFPKALEP